eukprot:5807119-Pyramimonas_sp.AAC.1
MSLDGNNLLSPLELERDHPGQLNISASHTASNTSADHRTGSGRSGIRAKQDVANKNPRSLTRTSSHEKHALRVRLQRG